MEILVALALLIAPGRFALQIQTQPAGCDLCVTEQPMAVSLFRTAWELETIGLLAHDNLAGRHFSELQAGGFLILSDQSGARIYRITELIEYRRSGALLVDPGGRSWSEYEVFGREYGQGGLVLQTCTPEGGFYFVRAVQVGEVARGGYNGE